MSERTQGDRTGRRPTILHVEDRDTNRALVRIALRRAPDPNVAGAELLEAGDLAAARETLAGHAVDLLLLDVRLPDGNGLDLASELHARPRTQRPWIMVMSASVLPSQQQVAMAFGADAFLAKPFQMAELQSRVSELLRA